MANEDKEFTVRRGEEVVEVITTPKVNSKRRAIYKKNQEIREAGSDDPLWSVICNDPLR